VFFLLVVDEYAKVGSDRNVTATVFDIAVSYILSCLSERRAIEGVKSCASSHKIEFF